MTVEQFIINILQAAPLVLLKLFVIALLLFHVSFSVILIKQTKTMIKVLEAQISPALYTISIIHFLFSLFVLIWVLIFQ